MRQADEICAHVANHLHFFARNVVRNSGGKGGVVFVAMGSAQEEFFSVQEKRPVLLKFKMPQTETLRADLLSVLAAEREAALIKRGRGRRPELWVSNGEFRKLPHSLPWLQAQALGMHGRAIGSRNRDRQVQGRRQFLRVV